jgi:hypothetical protein
MPMQQQLHTSVHTLLLTNTVQHCKKVHAAAEDAHAPVSHHFD